MTPHKLFAITLAAAGLGFAFTAARADDTTTAPPAPPADTVNGPAVDGSTPPPPPPGGHRRGGGYNLAELTQKLTLTAEQQQAIGGYITSGREQAKAVRDDSTLSKEDRRSKMMAIMQTTKSEIRADLTVDQQKIFDTLHVGRGPGGPPPPSTEPNAPVAPAPTPTPPTT